MTTEEREAVERELAELYARDLLELSDYEHWVEKVEGATTREELAALAADLKAIHALVPAGPEAIEPVTPGRPLVRAAEVPAAQKMTAVFSNLNRTRDWIVPRAMKVVAVFGNGELDFREARLGEGVTEVEVSAVFGKVTLIVPPDVRVEANGGGVFGNFEHRSSSRTGEASGATIRVSGRAVFGNVEIDERLPGESERMAIRRRRAEQKQLATAKGRELEDGRSRGQLPP